MMLGSRIGSTATSGGGDEVVIRGRRARRAGDAGTTGALLTIGSDRTDAHYACQSGRADVLEDAIAAGIDLSAADKHGHTALHCACTRGARSCVRLLLAHGAREDNMEQEFGRVRVNARDVDGRTPLHHAALAGEPGIIEMLVAAGAETQAMDANLETAIDVAGSAAAHVKLAAVAGVYNANERHETAILRVRNARALGPGGIYKLYRSACDEEKDILEEIRGIGQRTKDAEARYMMQRELNIHSSSSQRRKSSYHGNRRRSTHNASNVNAPPGDSRAVAFLRSLGHKVGTGLG